MRVFVYIVFTGDYMKNIIPNEALPNTAHIEILGNKECIIDGCKGIIEYNDTYIKLNIGAQLITFTGQDLSISSLNYENAVIEGSIMKIEFCS